MRAACSACFACSSAFVTHFASTRVVANAVAVRSERSAFLNILAALRSQQPSTTRIREREPEQTSKYREEVRVPFSRHCSLYTRRRLGRPADPGQLQRSALRYRWGDSVPPLQLRGRAGRPRRACGLAAIRVNTLDGDGMRHLTGKDHALLPAYRAIFGVQHCSAT